MFLLTLPKSYPIRRDCIILKLWWPIVSASIGFQRFLRLGWYIFVFRKGVLTKFRRSNVLLLRSLTKSRSTQKTILPQYGSTLQVETRAIVCRIDLAESSELKFKPCCLSARVPVTIKILAFCTRGREMCILRKWGDENGSGLDFSRLLNNVCHVCWNYRTFMVLAINSSTSFLKWLLINDWP